MKYKYTISGVDCPNCAAKLAELMSANDGITLAKINFLTERLTVESELAEEELLSILRNTASKFSKGISIK